MKRFTSVLLLALTVLAPFGSLAQTEYMNIAELREQTPTQWVESYKTKWRTVEIDAAINVPSIDMLPIVKVTYNAPGTGPTAEESGWELAEWRYDSLNLYNASKQAPKSVGGKRVNDNAEPREVWYSGFTPDSKYIPMSDITFDEICAMINENLSAFGYDPDQFEVATPTRLGISHWFLYGYKKDVLPGLLSLQARHKVKGLPILQHIHQAVSDHRNGDSRVDEMKTYFELHARYDGYGEKLLSVFVNAAKPIEILAEDVPLCPFSTVIAAIEPEINAGHIRKIYEVELGYAVYNEPGVYLSRKEPLVEGRNTPEEMEEGSAQGAAEHKAARYYLRPMWQVNCLWVSSPSGKLRETASYTMDERNTLDYRQLLVDAQTGELVQESTAQDRCEFKGFIPWEEVNRDR